MAAFAFRAVDAAGTPHRGVIEASSEVVARGMLRDRRLLPVALRATTAPVPGAPSLASVDGSRLALGSRAGKVSARTLAVVTRQLSTLIGSDVRIEEALRLVARQYETAPTGAVLLGVRSAILDGRSFAAALGEFPRAFPEFYRASVAAGERSGRLPQVLEHLADFVEARHRNAQKIQLALLYPALLAGIAGTMLVAMLIYVVPNIVKVFESRGADLPLLTRGLIALSNGLQGAGLLLLLALAGLALGTRAWLRRDANRLAFDRWFATTRPFARFSTQVNAARFAGSLATLVQSDVPLVDALGGAAAVTPNRYIRGQALLVAARVREGASLNGAMAEAGCFPPMLVAVVASGENSGRLARALGRAAHDLDREVDALATTTVGLVEPAVLLAMGGLVLLMVLAILLPIINLSSLATL